MDFREASAATVLFILLLAPSAYTAVHAYPSAGEHTCGTSLELHLVFGDHAEPAMQQVLDGDLVANGTARITRGNPSDPGDGKLEVEIEIVQMQLTGIRESLDKRSNGTIKQKTSGMDFPADSRIGLFIETEMALAILYNIQPMNFSTESLRGFCLGVYILEQAVDLYAKTPNHAEGMIAPQLLIPVATVTEGVLRLYPLHQAVGGAILPAENPALGYVTENVWFTIVSLAALIAIFTLMRDR